jgi:ABC-type uncharacterized transport system substrate-binding protein
MRRREFITLVGGAAASWPLAVRAQQGERMRRIGVLRPGEETDPTMQAYNAALRQELAKLGWIEGRNLRIDLRFATGDVNRVRAYAAELVSLAPDVIVTSGGAATRATQRQTQVIPIVFAGIGDTGDRGTLGNIARPEGNATGFTNFYASLGGKWLELLKEIAPHVTSVAHVIHPEFSTAPNPYFVAMEAAAPALGVKVMLLPVRNVAEMESAIGAFAAEPNGGLVVTGPFNPATQRGTIYRLALQHRLPAIYNRRDAIAEGGLIYHGSDSIDLNRRAASYVDRILRGAKPGDLPVEFPTKFDLFVNLKTAKAIGLTIPETFLVRADQVIE